MTYLTPGYLLALVRRSVTDPRDAAREVMATGLSPNARWLALALTSVLSALFLHVSVQLLPEGERAMLLDFPGPFQSAMMQAGLMLLSAVLAHRIGRWQGGTGTFDDALLLMVWLQAVLLVFQAVQILALLLLPSLSGLLGILGLGLFFWILTAFVAELHGFASLPKVFLGIIVAAAGLILVLSFVMVPFLSVGG